ncbi:MAG TPA: NUDIX hydrolase [Stenomitos sp.]
MDEQYPKTEAAWQVRDRFLELHSRWMTLIGEHLQDSEGRTLEYWRVEKADSVIVLPIQCRDVTTGATEQILLPQASYRPGIGQTTLDFPGGRVPVGVLPEQAAIATLQRELGVDASAIRQLISLNPKGWAVNSSFSNQKLYGFVAHLDASVALQTDPIAMTYPVTAIAVQALLSQLSCLQCRAVLLEWYTNLWTVSCQGEMSQI